MSAKNGTELEGEMAEKEMHSHFLVESILLMLTYGAKYLGIGLAIAIFIVIAGSRSSVTAIRLGLLAIAILALWVSSVISVEVGYSLWQSMPDPPDDAFSDTGAIFWLIAGWLPSGLLLGGLYRLLQAAWPPAKTIPDEGR